MQKTMIKPCVHCGKPFETSSVLRKYCSAKCQDVHNNMTRIRVCPVCNKEFSSKSSLTKYCSKDCAKKAKNQNSKLINKKRRQAEEVRFYKKKCGRTSCLYHPRIEANNGCDYCYLTGNKRGCPTGKECTRYEKVTKSERQAKRERLIEIQNIISEDGYKIKRKIKRA